MISKNILMTLLCACIALTGCKSGSKKDKMTSDKKIVEVKIENSEQLSDLLEERKVAFAKAAPEKLKKEYAEGIAAVENSGILEKALNVGDQVPDFELNNQMSKTVSLYNELKKGPVVLMWYRGGWCPYCNINLHYLQEKLSEFNKLGASLLALTPELPDRSLNTAEKHKLEFQVLSDVGNKVAKEYGVVFKLTPEVAAIYQKAFDMHGYNGDESDELPLAATYVIDQNGIIKYAFLDADYRNRAEPEEILKALSKLK